MAFPGHAGRGRPLLGWRLVARIGGTTKHDRRGRTADFGVSVMVMRSSLVLNASYEPLSVVPARRAACLVLAEKAELVECDGLLIRSASLTLASPLVIRLRYMVKVPYRRKASLSRRGVFARDDYRCQYCGAHADSIDHVTPRSRGGQHEWENVAAACRPCNLAKRDRTPDEAGMRLLRPCRVPRATAWVVASTTRVPEAWKPYLALAS